MNARSNFFSVQMQPVVRSVFSALYTVMRTSVEMNGYTRPKGI